MMVIAIVAAVMSQCTYRCVVLPDPMTTRSRRVGTPMSQCTYRCAVLPDPYTEASLVASLAESQCTYRCVVLPGSFSSPSLSAPREGLNAPTGAWCSLTNMYYLDIAHPLTVSMHLQVRGAP